MPRVRASSFVVDRNLTERLMALPWGLFVCLMVVSCIGLALLYAAGGGDISRYTTPQAIRLLMGLALMFTAALVPYKWIWHGAYPAYGAALLLLVAVELIGSTGKGAQRWLDLGVMNIQPSELMKITLLLALARFYHGKGSEESAAIKNLFVPLLLIGVPVMLVLRQPDLGTAILIAAGGAALIFAAGARARLFVGAFVLLLTSLPFVWAYLKDYQRDRILTFLNPERDPLGAGYHIMQSKIALGSGGLEGKGFLQGTQTQLNFLPEKHTDFIFTMFAEEFGFIGGIGLILTYSLIIWMVMNVALSSRSQFGRLLASGIGMTFFFYIFINVGMVMGLLPVVGVPLPLVSYGGTAMLTLLLAMGLVMNIHVNRDTSISRQGFFR